MGGGIYGLYVYVSLAISKMMYLGWLILSFTQSIVAVILGIGLLVYYKKSVHIWSLFSIFIPLIVFFTSVFLKDLIYYELNTQRIISDVAYLCAILISVFYWFGYRKKYPEEFGVKS